MASGRKVFAFFVAGCAVTGALAQSNGARASRPQDPQVSPFDSTEAPIFSLIVKHESDGPSAITRSLSKALNGASTVASVAEAVGDVSVVRLSEPLSLDEAEDVAERLSSEPSIEWAEPNKLNRRFTFPSTPPDDAYWDDMWNLWGDFGVGLGDGPETMSTVWTQGRGAGVTVAVLDTGYITHPDLTGQLLAGYDFVSSFPFDDHGWVRHPGLTAAQMDNDGDVLRTSTYGAVGRDRISLDPGDWSVDGEDLYPSSWHGTHVAGTIVARTNNSRGVSGVAPDAKVLPVRVLGWLGGLDSDIADAIRWSAGERILGVSRNSNPAKVINLSLGGEGDCGEYMQSAIDYAVGRGAIVVVAAGNDGLDASLFSPANCNNVVTVAATDRSGDLAWYSNYSNVDIAAPGGDTSIDEADGVYSTLSSTETGYGYPGYSGAAPTPSYGAYQGTSMATPHVSGAIAVIRSARPNWSDTKILNELRDTAREAGPLCDVWGCGAGIIDLPAVLASSVPDAPTSVTGIPSTTSMRVVWRTPSSDGGMPITGYTVRAFLDSSGGEAVASCSPSSLARNECSLRGLARRRNYYLEVVATNALGNSAPSSPRAVARTR